MTVTGGAGIRLQLRGFQMRYKKTNVELVVMVDEAEAVVAKSNAPLDQVRAAPADQCLLRLDSN